MSILEARHFNAANDEFRQAMDCFSRTIIMMIAYEIAGQRLGNAVITVLCKRNGRPF